MHPKDERSHHNFRDNDNSTVDSAKREGGDGFRVSLEWFADRFACAPVPQANSQIVTS